MLNFGAALIFLSPLVLIVGLIFPRLFSKKGMQNPNRWRGVGAGALVFAVGSALAVTGAFNETGTTAPSTAQNDHEATPKVSPAPAPSPTTKTAKMLPAPVPDMSVENYLANCHKLAGDQFAADSLGKSVGGVLFFIAPEESGAEQIMAVPGNHSTVFSVTFAKAPDWGSAGATGSTGRRVDITATVGARPQDGGIALMNARVVENDAWRTRAVAMAKERSDILDALWPQAGGVSFWVAMRSTGQSRDKDAEQLCKVLWRAGRPANTSIAVTVLDAQRIQQQAEIGKAYCR